MDVAGRLICGWDWPFVELWGLVSCNICIHTYIITDHPLEAGGRIARWARLRSLDSFSFAATKRCSTIGFYLANRRNGDGGLFDGLFPGASHMILQTTSCFFLALMQPFSVMLDLWVEIGIGSQVYIQRHSDGICCTSIRLTRRPSVLGFAFRSFAFANLSTNELRPLLTPLIISYAIAAPISWHRIPLLTSYNNSYVRCIVEKANENKCKSPKVRANNNARTLQTYHLDL